MNIKNSEEEQNFQFLIFHVTGMDFKDILLFILISKKVRSWLQNNDISFKRNSLTQITHYRPQLTRLRWNATTEL